ncbi:hypothetical protein ACHAXN_005663 [Cyclotella atomus]
MSFGNKNRAMTPKGQMSGNGSGPAIMMMPPHIRATFLPNPPIKHLPSFKRHVLQSDNYITEDEEDAIYAATAPSLSSSQPTKTKGPSGVSFIPHSFPPNKKGTGLTGISSYLSHFERTAPPPRTIHPTPRSLKEEKQKSTKLKHEESLKPLIEAYRNEQKACGGEHPKSGMNCYNTLFIGRLAYEVTERKLLREFEQFGPVKDLTIVTDSNKKSRGYAFVEYEHEEDMKRAYRAADGMRLEGRHIVVDVERGHTVPNWLPRRLGGGLGGTRLGGKEVNMFMPGRFDPTKKPMIPPQMMGGAMLMPPPPHQMMNGPPPPGYREDNYHRGPPPPSQGYGGRFEDRGPPLPSRRFDDRGPPPPTDRRGGPGMWERGGGGGYNDDRKRRRSRSPDRGDRRRGRY